MYQITTAGIAVLPQADGKVRSLVSGNTFNDVTEVDNADAPQLRFLEALARRTITPREQAQQGLENPNRIRDRKPEVRGSTTKGWKPPTRGEAARAAADHTRRMVDQEKISPREQMVREAEERAAKLEAEEQAANERKALLERDDVKTAVSEAREIQRWLSFTDSVRESDIDRAEKLVELARSAQFSEFEELKGKLRNVINEKLGIDEQVAEQEARIQSLRTVGAFFNPPTQPEPEPGEPRRVRFDANNPEHVKTADRVFDNLLVKVD